METVAESESRIRQSQENMTDSEAKDELTETYNRIDPELSLIHHTMRYAAWAESLLSEFREKTSILENNDAAYEWYREMEDAILNIRNSYTDWVAHFCGYGSVGESQGGFGDEVRYVRQPYLEHREDRKELFKEMMEFAGFPFLYEKDDVIAFYHPDCYRFRMNGESKFDVPEGMEEHIEE